MTTSADLDATIHSPKRLAAMAILASSTTADFSYLREQLQLADSDLSKQMSALRDEGYVEMKKLGTGAVDRRVSRSPVRSDPYTRPTASTCSTC